MVKLTIGIRRGNNSYVKLINLDFELKQPVANSSRIILNFTPYRYNLTHFGAIGFK